MKHVLFALLILLFSCLLPGCMMPAAPVQCGNVGFCPPQTPIRQFSEPMWPHLTPDGRWRLSPESSLFQRHQGLAPTD